MLRVARWFYKDGLKQEQIAKALRCDVRKVRWLLNAAKQNGIVRIDIDEQPGEEIESLQNEFLKRYPHLKKVVIVPGGAIESEAEYSYLLRKWGFEAAAYLDTLADSGQDLQVGVSGGETILEAMTALPNRLRANVHFYALALIGRGRLVNASHVDPSINSTVGWARSGRLPGHCHYATVPPYDRDLGSRRAIADELNRLAARKPIEHVIRDMDEINVAFVGLGVVNPGGNNPALTNSHINRIAMTGLLKPLGITPNDLAKEGAFGDLAYCLFDSDGQENPRDAQGNKLSKDHWRFFLTAGHYDAKRRGVEFYRQMVKESEAQTLRSILNEEIEQGLSATGTKEGKKVIAIAGAFKEDAILVGLKGKLFNVWFTNEAAARKIAEAD
jgi:DNA-binding transcriptional regulator LsrR (DeoR family)